MNTNNSLVKYANDLHQIPELGFEEYKTSKYIYNQLQKMGYTPEYLFETGVSCYIDNKKPQSICIRADIDALPLNERTQHKFKSQHENKMHACGHDAHMAMLLEFAKEIKFLQPKKNVLLLFQPSEEANGGGAQKVIATNIFQKYNISEIYALHLNPEIEAGFLATKAGAIMARSCEWDFEIKTKGTHGAQPQNGVDATLVCANFIIAINTIISRNMDPLNTAVVTIGQTTSGVTNNVCSNQAFGRGIIRTFSSLDMNLIMSRINDISKGLQLTYNCDININFYPSYPEVNNNKELYNKVKTMKNMQSINKQMICEDFAYYAQKMKALFVFLGVKNTKIKNYPLHNDKFSYVATDLQTGVNFYKTLVEN